MRIKKITTATIKLLLPILLGGVILYWMYRDFDFKRIESVMLYDMDWTWMLLSLPFGITAQLFRGIRWRQTLEPVGERPRLSTCVNSIFLSYAASLVIPRIGEFTRCGVLSRCDGVSFPKALGTVVTERAIDTLLVMLITGLTLLAQMRIFGSFFQSTGTSLDSILRNFSESHPERNMAGYDIAQEREEHPALHHPHPGDMGKLLPALLPHVLLL